MIMAVCTPLSMPDKTKSVSRARHKSVKKVAVEK